jgi:O-antigen biosynthesis protein WbqP
MKRFFDLVMAMIILFMLAIPMLLIAIIIRLSSKGPALYWSDRIGKRNVTFKMPKFRSMRIDTPVVATDLMIDHSKYISPFGSFLRLTSLDEMPQLFSVLKGDMSFVGPRPALYNQDDLISLRATQGIDNLLPGITGWAQVNGRDNLLLQEKVGLDKEYLEKQSFWFDLKILWMTLLKVLKQDNIKY